MKRGGLVVEHHVVRARDAHDEVDARRAEQGQQHVHVVLVGFGVVGVADVATHGHAEQLAAEVVLQPGADDLLAVVEVFRADEADHGVHQQRLVAARDGVGAGLAGLLIDAVMGVGRERAALAGLEIHEVVAEGAALLRQAGLVAFLQRCQVDAEAGVGRLGAGDGLEHQVQRRAAVDRLDGGGDMGEDATLGRNLVAADHRVEHLQQLADAGGAVGGRVDADHRVAVAVEQAVENARGDAGAVVGGMVRLQPGGHASGQADAVAKAGDDADLLRDEDQVLHAHDLRHRGDNFRRQPRCEGFQRRLVRLLAEQPVAEIAHGQVADRREGGGVMAVDDQPSDFIAFVGDQCFFEKTPERHIGQAHLRRHSLGVAARRDPGEQVAGARRAGLGHHLAQIVKAPGGAAHAVRVRHGCSPYLSVASACSIAANSSSGVPATRWCRL